ncbi:heme exporter protein CcmD [Asticcacaulis tiandongensis]|uniref:heme exporter protein CcmD n=1 Tax=Asticcacaulis tiandongensis TaxID=2565365 RepID=UPI001FE56552|nr:heme exporter protein CcmD [Asticcacaulis tiandongensis]
MIDLDMGKYVFYVWGSYGATAVALISLTIASVIAHRTQKRKLQALLDESRQP